MSLRRIAQAFSRCLPVAALLVDLTGCSVLSGAGAIRVEVEVYKGPLSREPSVQVAELLALWNEFNNTLLLYQESVCAAFVAQQITTREDQRRPLERMALASVPGCGSVVPIKEASAPLMGSFTSHSEPNTVAETSPLEKGNRPLPQMIGNDPNTAPSQKNKNYALQQKCLQYYGDESALTRQAEGAACFYLAQVHLDTQHLFESLGEAVKLHGPAKASAVLMPTSTGDGAPSNLPKEVRQFLFAVSHAAMLMRTKAYNWAHSQVSFPVRDRTTRAVVNNFSNITSEFGNQLGARADALLKQFSDRDSRYQYADYLPQNIYLRDSQPTDFLNLYVWNRAAAPAIWEEMLLHPLDAFDSEETATRVRTFERLYADNYWSRINTVTAVGTGEFRIALVKDDIGNWNLKSFDSDPSELLQAYKNASLALIQKAVSLAQNAANPAGGATGLLGMANQLALGGAPASPESASPESTAQITVLRRQAMERMRTAYNNAKAKTDAGEDAQQVRDATMGEWKSILAEHARIASALSEAALSKGSDPTAPLKPDAAATTPLKPGADRIPVPKILPP
jgi:hypothetical protein